MSEDQPTQSKGILIDVSKLPDRQQGQFAYALHVRKHLTHARATVMDALAAEVVTSVGAQLMTELVDSIDRAVLADIGMIAGVEIPEGHALLDAMEVTSDPRRAQ